MPQKTDPQLLAEGQAIQNQTVAGANTAPVVGGVFVDTIDSKINNDKVVTNITGASDINIPSEKAVYNKLLNKQDALSYVPEDVANKSTDGTLSANSDTLYPSQKAVKTYVNSKVASNNLDAVLTNGNFSSQQANVGAIGLIGATSGFTGQITQDDYHFDFDTNIGKSFQIEHGAITMSNVTGINNNTSLSLLASNITSQKTQNFPNKNGTFAMTSDLAPYELLANKSIDATLSANSDTLYPSQKAVKTYVDAHSGGASYVPTISITYSNLASLIAAGSLVQGQKYLINDYRTVHQIPNTTDVNTGDLEPLIVTAATSNTLSPVAISTTFPKDIIWYNFTSDQNAIPGCTKGYIYRRIDTIQNNDIPFDFRNVKFRRWQINVTTQDATGAVGTYTKGQVVKKTGTTSVYVKLTNANGGDFTDASFWFQLGVVNNSSYISPTSSQWQITNDLYSINIPCSASYQDYNMWANSSYYNTAYNNTIASVEKGTTGGNLAKFNTVIFSNNFQYNNIGSFFYNNSILGGFNKNNIGNNFYNNFIDLTFTDNNITSDFYNNLVGKYFTQNAIQSYTYGNIFSDNFKCNVIDNGFNNNSISIEFKFNTISTGFTFNIINSNFYENRIGLNFYNNTILSFCIQNNIEDTFQGNTIGLSFGFNNIGSYFRSNTIGLSCSFNNIGKDFTANNIGIDFQQNSILSGNFYGCTIGNNFSYNTINAFFASNVILNNFQYNTVNGFFSNKNITSTQAYQTYSCIIGNTNSNPFIQYVDGFFTTQTIALS
jgi:hypothetical protein